MTPNIALFAESNAGLLDGEPATYQTLIFPHSDTIKVYSRVSNGSRGRGQVWQPNYDLSSIPDTPINRVPVAIMLNERDIAMADLGLVTNMAVKALYASANASEAFDMPHNDIVTELVSRLELGDTTLTDLIVDKRRTNPVTAPSATYQPNPSMLTPTTIPTNPTNNESMAMNLVTVPHIKFAESYINRKFDGITEWDIYDHALANGVNVLLEGEAGSGKTISVQSYASARGMRYFNIPSNAGIDPSQLIGRWIPNPNGQGGYIWQDGAVTQLVRKGGVLLINEVNFLPPRISTVLFSLLDYRREIQLLDNGGETIVAHKDLLIVADMNMGYKGTQELNSAFNDRFGIKLEFPYDRAIEHKIIKSKALLTLADQLRDQYLKEEISRPISTRSLVAFRDNASKFGVDFAISSFVNGFDKDERGGVRLACETHKHNLVTDLQGGN